MYALWVLPLPSAVNVSGVVGLHHRPAQDVAAQRIGQRR